MKDVMKYYQKNHIKLQLWPRIIKGNDRQKISTKKLFPFCSLIPLKYTFKGTVTFIEWHLNNIGNDRLKILIDPFSFSKTKLTHTKQTWASTFIQLSKLRENGGLWNIPILFDRYIYKRDECIPIFSWKWKYINSWCQRK